MNIYDTATLIGLIATLPPAPSTYWLDLYFPQVQNFEQEWIEFDKIHGNRRMAPFVVPTAVGKPIMATGFNSMRFKPAYIKPKTIIDPTRLIKRRAGEGLYGTLSLAERRDAVVAQELLEHRNMIHRRWEWLACEAVVKGKVTIVGDDYPSTLVDFQRNAANTVTLSGTSLWTDQTNSDPITDIENWSQAFQVQCGYVPDRITMGLTAWRAYRNHPKVLAQANTLIRGTQGSVNLSPITSGTIAQRVTQVSDTGIEIWVYNDIYEDNTGAAVSFLDQTNIVMTSAGLQGVRCFGAILDARQGYTPVDIFAKQWISEDPAAEFMMTQSAPLMVPLRPDCSFVAKVA